MMMSPVAAGIRICPKAPDGADQAVQGLGGNFLWVVIFGFTVAVIASIAAILCGRIFHMQRVSVAGWISLVVTAAAAVAMVVAPGIINGILGQGCVG